MRGVLIGRLYDQSWDPLKNVLVLVATLPPSTAWLHVESCVVGKVRLCSFEWPLYVDDGSLVSLTV